MMSLYRTGLVDIVERFPRRNAKIGQKEYRARW